MMGDDEAMFPIPSDIVTVIVALIFSVLTVV